MSVGARRILVAVLPVLVLLPAGCSASTAHSPSIAARTPVATDLDTVFTSPSGRYTMRYNHTWAVQQVLTQAGVLDFFTLPDATLAVATDRVFPGTQLEAWVRSTMQQYQSVHIQGLERVGTVSVGGGRGELVRASTYVTPEGLTAFTPPSPGSKPRTLYQAFYLAGDQSFTFSIAWPQTDKTDYLSVFRSVLQTFTLAGTT